ncbi:TPA: LysM peptidoglycan-binding domain-containing protein, partial [Escherichia coli]|nr:LysM peptidoglycan-binding domain-containing protein [Escherichia coli]HAM3730831.1 LysM peptidoglycan-binding domain-containing protein [Escherichia coli]HAM4871937.1 LysM peptidoglycan-binding domain-containing protein [Escherichia coli]
MIYFLIRILKGREGSQSSFLANLKLFDFSKGWGGIKRVVQILMLVGLCLPPAFSAEKNAGGKSPEMFSMTWPQQPTRPYTLKPGETINDVASKYHISLDDLRRMNVYRVFANSFEHVKAGDELDVPAVEQTADPKREKLAGSVSSGKDNSSDDDVAEERIAGAATQVGGMLSIGVNKDKNAAGAMARGIVTSRTNEEIQKWFNQFGTARIRLNVDNEFSMKNSQADILLPIWEQANLLTFAQSSVHRTDSRNQINQGVGVRYFTANVMYGSNIFLDYDLSRSHSRLGWGGEYGMDYFKLTANGYFRLSGWRDSPDMEDYRERPSNGWDLRVEGYLPRYPQLGAKLVFEQYYGDKVALFDKNSLLQDPYAVTYGVNYTPFPLLTFNVEQRAGKSGKNDTEFGLEFSYQIGTPLEKQLAGSKVASRRSLLGSRYDLVDRRNDIVLEYQKKEVIHLFVTNMIRGSAGQMKSVTVSVTSTYALSRIEWNDASLLANGGQVTQVSEKQYNIVLPVYQTGPAAQNTYDLGVTAYDIKGNTSSTEHIAVIVDPAVVDGDKSSFT